MIFGRSPLKVGYRHGILRNCDELGLEPLLLEIDSQLLLESPDLFDDSKHCVLLEAEGSTLLLRMKDPVNLLDKL